jgi:hypothetical protein
MRRWFTSHRRVSECTCKQVTVRPGVHEECQGSTQLQKCDEAIRRQIITQRACRQKETSKWTLSFVREPPIALRHDVQRLNQAPVGRNTLGLLPAPYWQCRQPAALPPARFRLVWCLQNSVLWMPFRVFTAMPAHRSLQPTHLSSFKKPNTSFSLCRLVVRVWQCDGGVRTSARGPGRRTRSREPATAVASARSCSGNCG